MARLFFIRHGQASFLKSNYDQLSELGVSQATALGQFWKAQGIKIDRLYSGGLQRQIETACAFLDGYQSPCTVCSDPGFDEHHGPEIVKPYYPEKFVLEKEIDPKDFHKIRRDFYGTYFKLAIPWVKNALDPDKVGHIEPWHQFRGRFRRALEDVLEHIPRGANILIFTSSGPVGAALGEALLLDDVKTIELSWQVKNTSVSEFLVSKNRFSLVSFNEVPHLTDPNMTTLV